MSRSSLKLQSKAVVVAVLAGTWAPALGQAPGVISGTVLDDQKLPVSGALLLWNKVSDLRRDATGHIGPVGRVLNGRIQTGATGAFSISPAPAGEYYLCASGPKITHLRSCEWGGEGAPVRVAAGQTVSGLVLTVREGVIVNLRIQDPNSRLTSMAHFLVGWMDDLGHYARAGLASRAGTQVTYATVVPKGLQIRLFIDTPIDIRDAAGRPVDKLRPSLALNVGQGPDITLDLRAN